jgi:hypothetical protein
MILLELWETLKLQKPVMSKRRKNPSNPHGNTINKERQKVILNAFGNPKQRKRS